MNKQNKSSAYTTFISALFVAVIFLFTACGKKEQTTEERQPYVMPDSLFKTLVIDTVKQCQMVNAITLTGQVDFNQDNVVNIYPLVSGNIQGITTALGDYVQRGQTLGVIRSTEVAGYSNDLVNAETNLAVAEKNLAKTKDMYRGGLASMPDSLAAEATYQQAKSDLSRVREVLNISGGNSGSGVVKSPISGFIVQKNVTNNTAIRIDNGNSLFTISDLRNVWVWANVYESNINNIHMGDGVDITTVSYPDRVFKGKVDKIMNMLDSGSKVMKVRIVLDNSDYALKPQMFVTVTATNQENKQALCISSHALIFDNSQYYVLVYKSRKDITITPVQIINTIGDRTYIQSGVQPGQQLVASQALLVYGDLND